MKNVYSDIYLYAKNHYEITDVINDLKKICGKITGCEPEFIGIHDL